jgi:hypothetical protein
MAFREAAGTQHFLQSFRRGIPPTPRGRPLADTTLRSDLLRSDDFSKLNFMSMSQMQKKDFVGQETFVRQGAIGRADRRVA